MDVWLLIPIWIACISSTIILEWRWGLAERMPLYWYWVDIKFGKYLLYACGFLLKWSVGQSTNSLYGMKNSSENSLIDLSRYKRKLHAHASRAARLAAAYVAGCILPRVP